MVPSLIIAEDISRFASLVQFNRDPTGRTVLQNRDLIQAEPRTLQSVQRLPSKLVIPQTGHQPNLSPQRRGMMRKIGRSPAESRPVRKQIPENFSKGDNNRILVSHEVTALDKHDFYTRIVTSQDAFNTKYIINCAGLQCDRIARMDSISPKMKIVPFRGDYYELTEEAREKVKTLIYPVPDPALPFLGVHFTRTIDGTVECGPNAVFSFKREGYGKYDFNLTDTWNALSYPGLWKMFFRYWRYGFREYTRSLSRALFLKQLKKLIPSLESHDIKPCKAGIRAQALKPNGEPIDDFRIERKGNSIHVLNAPSPAATASLAIGDYISQMAADYFKLPTRRKENDKAKSVKKRKKRKSASTSKVKK